MRHRSGRNLARWLGAYLVWTMHLPAAWAQGTSGLAVQLEYQAAAECPSATRFAREVTARAPALQILTKGDATSPRLRVRAQKGAHAKKTRDEGPHGLDNEGYDGSVEIVSSKGQSLQRELHAATCEALITALAVVSSVAIDASMKDQPSDAGLVPASPQQPLSVAPSAPPLGDQRSAVAGASDTLETHGELPPPHRLDYVAGVDGRMRTGVAPTSTLGAGLFVGFSAARRWMPAARLSVVYLRSSDVAFPGGLAHYSLVTAEAESCPVALRTRRWALAPCATFEVGRLQGTAEHLAHSESPQQTFWAVGGAIRATWDFSEALFADADFSLRSPLKRASFYVDDPYVLVHHVPRLLLEGGLGLGVRFPVISRKGAGD